MVSGIISPAIKFIANLNYVAIAVIGGLRDRVGHDVARRRAGVHPVLAPVHQPIVQTASIANVLQSTIASAERVFELLDEAEEEPGATTPEARCRSAGTSSGERLVPLRAGHAR